MDIHRVYRIFMVRFRPARMKIIKEKFGEILNGSGSVLDLGGTASWWRDIGPLTKNITIVNLDSAQEDEVIAAGYKFVAADACSLPFAEGSFDLAFSNSVIEHVGGWSNQIDFSKELLRCGKQVYLQTPNKWFFVEPHLITLFIHWLPFGIQRRLIRWFSIWGLVTKPDQARIDEVIKGLNLLGRREIESLFPGCEIYQERFLGFVKSFVVVKH